MAVDPQSQRNIDDTTNYIQDTLISVSAKIGEVMKDAIDEAFEGADATVLQSMGRDLTRAFKSAAKYSDVIASNNFKISQGLIGSKDIEKQQQELALKREVLERKFLALTQQGIEFKEEDRIAALEALNVQGKELDENAERVKKMEDNMGYMGEIFTRLSKNKFFGSILNAEAGLIAMRKAADKGTSGFKLLGVGIKSAFAGIEKASIILFVANQIKNIAKFFKDLAFGVSQQVADLAKGLGTSLTNARSLQASFYQIQKFTTNLVYNVRTLGESAVQLAENFGYARVATEDILKSQVLLTKRVGATAQEAANLNMLFKATGQNTELAFEHMNQLGIKMQQIDGIGVDIKTVVKDISQAGAEVASYFGYSTTALAEAVINARKLGLNLTQAKTISKGLLDFENSISAQLELSVLTQKQFNFGNAMAKAAMGDIAGATQDVIRQMNQLTAEQRKSPIILEAMSKATGLSTDELAKQYALQYDINTQKEEYGRILAKEGKAKALQYLVGKGIALAEVKDIEDRISASERFNQALDAAKDAFGRLVSSGLLDRMIMSLEKVIEKLEWLFGISASDKYEMEKKRIELYGTDEEKELLKKTEKEFNASIAPKQTQADEEFKLGLESMRYSGTKDYTFKAAGKKVIDVEAQTQKFHQEQLAALEALRLEMAKKQLIKVNGNDLTALNTTHNNIKKPGAIQYSGM